MIIAYPLEDIRSMVNRKKTYQKKGVPCKVVNMSDNMAILETKSGQRFPVNTDRIVWVNTCPP